MSTHAGPQAILLHRPWSDRVAERAGALWRRLRAALAAAQARRRERRALDDAMELDEATLRDIGAPLWMQVQARARREARQFEYERLGLRSDRVA